MTHPKSAPRPRRRSFLPAALLTVLFGAGAMAGATAVFSSRTQGITEDFTGRLVSGINASGVARVEKPVYRRGFTSSTQTMTVVLGSDARSGPVVLFVTNQIRHGPFPGLQGVGQATVDTQIRFADPGVQAQIDRAFAGKKPVIHTVVGLNGGTDTRIEVPGGSVTEDGGTVTWQALNGKVRVNGLATASSLVWPGLTLRAPDGRAEISGVSLSGTSRRSSA